jgi:tRNA G46 methylase TrmB
MSNPSSLHLAMANPSSLSSSHKEPVYQIIPYRGKEFRMGTFMREEQSNDMSGLQERFYKKYVESLIEIIQPIAPTNYENYIDIDKHYVRRANLLVPLSCRNFMMDAQGWYSIMTRGAVVSMIQRFIRFDFSVIYDFFAGCGGTTYGLAEAFPNKKVIGVELDTVRHHLLSHNTRHLNNVETICDNAWNCLDNISSNSVIFMSPPWGSKIQKTLDTIAIGSHPNDHILRFIEECLQSRPKILIVHLPRYLNLKFYKSGFSLDFYHIDWYMIKRPENHPGNNVDSLLLVYTRR